MENVVNKYKKSLFKVSVVILSLCILNCCSERGDHLLSHLIMVPTLMHSMSGGTLPVRY